MLRTLLTIFAVTLFHVPSARAAAWPDNWLGAPDNSYRVLKIGVFYYGAVLHDLPGANGDPALPGDVSEWLDLFSGIPDLSAENQLLQQERVEAELADAARSSGGIRGSTWRLTTNGW